MQYKFHKIHNYRIILKQFLLINKTKIITIVIHILLWPPGAGHYTDVTSLAGLFGAFFQEHQLASVLSIGIILAFIAVQVSLVLHR